MLLAIDWPMDGIFFYCIEKFIDVFIHSECPTSGPKSIIDRRAKLVKNLRSVGLSSVCDALALQQPRNSSFSFDLYSKFYSHYCISRGWDFDLEFYMRLSHYFAFKCNCVRIKCGWSNALYQCCNRRKIHAYNIVDVIHDHNEFVLCFIYFSGKFYLSWHSL